MKRAEAQDAIETLSLTAHVPASGEYVSDNPSGYVHATIWRVGDVIRLKASLGEPSHHILALEYDGWNLHYSVRNRGLWRRDQVAKTHGHLLRVRVTLAYDVQCWIDGAELPEGMRLATPDVCAACGRPLTAGASLMPQDGPEGWGFYGPKCANRGGTERQTKHKQGLSAMDALIQKGRQK